MRLDKVFPQITDPAIDNWLDPHFVATAQGPSRRQQLLVFLSGSYGRPGRQLMMMKEAIALGYPVINLNYPNSWTVAELCQTCEDKDCHEKIRAEIIDGMKRSDKIDIGRPNSIENRLVRLLQYLHQQQPEENWRQYLEGETPKWEAIVVAGHSQGGGHAAMIAQERLVARVVMLSAPADYSPICRDLAPWLAAPHATPSDRYYGFIHLKDAGLARVQHAWQRLGMGALDSAVNVDDQVPPYHHAQCLITAAKPARPRKYHGCVANDLHTPKLLNGVPKFQKVWRYLLAGLE
ncbi:MAG: hypothetical protein AAGE59_34215 [Cyanobacteria bacterium P01_F01_bin.86]